MKSRRQTAAKAAPAAADGGFAAAVVKWQRAHGRHNLPWQNTQDAYKIWVSEVMLQQTQVKTVVPYYQKFMRRFPNLAALARAQEGSALAMWSGLGYYARARNLRAAARAMRAAGGMPQTAAGWRALPGVGKSAANAIVVFSQGERLAILDGNVRRVLSRVFAMPLPPATAAGQKALWALAENLLPNKKQIRPYTQGLMDLGAGVCRHKSPACGVCPLARRCKARQQNAVENFPARIAPPAKKTETMRLLFARAGGRVLLCKRPAAGIWGGLWCLPPAPPRRDLRARLPAAVFAARPLQLTHELTHRKLLLRVERCVLPAATPPPAGARWFLPSRALRLGLPAPARALLAAAAKDKGQTPAAAALPKNGLLLYNCEL